MYISLNDFKLIVNNLLGKVLWRCSLFWLTFPWNAMTTVWPVLLLPWPSVPWLLFRRICCPPTSAERCPMNPVNDDDKFVIILLTTTTTTISCEWKTTNIRTMKENKEILLLCICVIDFICLLRISWVRVPYVLWFLVWFPMWVWAPQEIVSTWWSRPW